MHHRPSTLTEILSELGRIINALSVIAKRIRVTHTGRFFHMPLDQVYQDLASEVEALTEVGPAISTAFAGQQQIISDLKAKIDALQNGSGDQSAAIAEIAKDVASLHELNAVLRSVIPANTEVAPATDPAPVTDNDGG